MFQTAARIGGTIMAVAAFLGSNQPGVAQVRGSPMPRPPNQDAAAFKPFAPPASGPIQYYGNYGPYTARPYGGYSREPSYRVHPDDLIPASRPNYFGSFPYYDNYYFFNNEPILSPGTIQDPVYPDFAGANQAPRDRPLRETYQPPVVTPELAAAPAEAVARVRVSLPANAELWFNGTLVPGTGAQREFKTPPLSPGGRYAYEVRARWQENGHDVVQTRQVAFRPGEDINLDFTAAPSDGDRP
jgi:uncharacterized protein (TIGR03000 family)